MAVVCCQLCSHEIGDAMDAQEVARIENCHIGTGVYENLVASHHRRRLYIYGRPARSPVELELQLQLASPHGGLGTAWNHCMRIWWDKQERVFVAETWRNRARVDACKMNGLGDLFKWMDATERSL